MSTRRAEAHYAGTVDGHNDAQAGRPERNGPPATTTGRDGYTLIEDQADADAYWRGYVRSYEDEAEARS